MKSWYWSSLSLDLIFEQYEPYWFVVFHRPGADPDGGGLSSEIEGWSPPISDNPSPRLPTGSCFLNIVFLVSCFVGIGRSQSSSALRILVHTRKPLAWPKFVPNNSESSQDHRSEQSEDKKALFHLLRHTTFAFTSDSSTSPPNIHSFHFLTLSAVDLLHLFTLPVRVHSSTPRIAFVRIAQFWNLLFSP